MSNSSKLMDAAEVSNQLMGFLADEDKRNEQYHNLMTKLCKEKINKVQCGVDVCEWVEGANPAKACVPKNFIKEEEKMVNKCKTLGGEGCKSNKGCELDDTVCKPTKNSESIEKKRENELIHDKLLELLEKQYLGEVNRVKEDARALSSKEKKKLKKQEKEDTDALPDLEQSCLEAEEKEKKEKKNGIGKFWGWMGEGVAPSSESCLERRSAQENADFGDMYAQGGRRRLRNSLKGGRRRVRNSLKGGRRRVRNASSRKRR